MNSLPLFIYTAYLTGEPTAIDRAFGAASVLLAMVLVLFVVTRILSRDKGGGHDEGLGLAHARRPRRALGDGAAGVVRRARLGDSLRAAADSTALIEGSGSSWAANAVNQWVADVASEGIQVVYTPDGDAQGRQDFATRTSDFSVTSIGYQGVDPVTGVNDTSQGRPYAYLPIAAGGTSFPYQIRYDGKQVRNLRLSGETLAKIFTNQITNWDDPEITADNNGHALPSLPITPVVQSEGSGATAQLTQLLRDRVPEHLEGLLGIDGDDRVLPAPGRPDRPERVERRR